jgi:thioredoxin 1
MDHEGTLGHRDDGQRPPSEPTTRECYAMTEIKDATEQTFSDLVINSDRPVVVDFWARWFGPCKQVAAELKKLAEKYEGNVDVVRVDIDASPTLAGSFDNMSLPTIAYFRQGMAPVAVAGFRNLKDLERIFDLPAAA